MTISGAKGGYHLLSRKGNNLGTRRRALAGLMLLLVTAAPATAQVNVSVGIGLPSLDIGIHLPALPTLTVVPGSPVYYAPSVEANFFFYDGMYWVYQNDN